jgi:hypothetical protein
MADVSRWQKMAMRCRLVSVGRYALRGVAQPQELFTLDSAETSRSA